MCPKKHFSQIKEKIDRHPKTILITMFFVLLLGVVLIFVRRYHRTPPKNGFHNVYHSVKKDNYAPLKGYKDLFEIMEMKEEFNNLISKDSLTAEDSTQLKLIDKKLNEMLYEY